MVNATTTAWKGRHPASGFLHGIADTHAENRIIEQIDEWDKLLLNKPNKWGMWLKKDKRWSAMHLEKKLQVAYAHIKGKYELLKEPKKSREADRWTQWTKHFVPLQPRTLRIDAGEVGLREPLRQPTPPDVANLLKSKPNLEKRRDALQQKRNSLLDRRHDYWKETGRLLLKLRTHLRAKFKYDLRIQLTISNSYGYPMSGRKAPWLNWYWWERDVKDIVKDARAKFGNVEFDLWNEPDLKEYFKGWSSDWKKFLQTWVCGVQAAKAVAPTVLLVGPSLGTFGPAYLEEFIEKMKKFKASSIVVHGDAASKEFIEKMKAVEGRNMLPDVLSWHDQYDANGIEKHVETTRKWLGSKEKPNVFSHRGVPIEIDINEYLLDGEGAPCHKKHPRTFRWYNRPGRTVHFIAALDAAQVRAACHTTVRDDGPGGRKGAKTAELETLDGLLTVEWKRRSTWHVYRRYATMHGQFSRVAARAGRGISGIASCRETGEELCALLGRDDDSGNASDRPTRVRFTHLPPLLRHRRSIEAFRIHIHDHPQKKSHEWRLAKNVEYKVIHESPRMLELEILHVGRYDALFVRLSARKKRGKS